MNNNKQYWSGICFDSCLPRQEAIEAAVEWLADRPHVRHTVLDEMHPPTPNDLPDYTAEVIEMLSDHLQADDQLSWEDGWPWLPSAPQPGPELDALRAALRAYIATHVDLSEAAWVPTGRYLIVHRDGQVEEVGGAP